MASLHFWPLYFSSYTNATFRIIEGDSWLRPRGLRCSTSSEAVCAFANVAGTQRCRVAYTGNCEIKARCDGSQTVASGGKCRRGSVQPSTSRGYKEIALWLAGRHVAPVNNSLANLYRCFSATMIYLRQEMYPSSIYVHFDITFTTGRDSWHSI